MIKKIYYTDLKPGKLYYYNFCLEQLFERNKKRAIILVLEKYSYPCLGNLYYENYVKILLINKILTISEHDIGVFYTFQEL